MVCVSRLLGAEKQELRLLLLCRVRSMKFSFRGVAWKRPTGKTAAATRPVADVTDTTAAATCLSALGQSGKLTRTDAACLECI